jgi:hypothetical protein
MWCAFQPNDHPAATVQRALWQSQDYQSRARWQTAQIQTDPHGLSVAVITNNYRNIPKTLSQAATIPNQNIGIRWAVFLDTTSLTKVLHHERLVCLKVKLNISFGDRMLDNRNLFRQIKIAIIPLALKADSL